MSYDTEVPWNEAQPNDLITSQAWNQLQIDAKRDIAAHNHSAGAGAPVPGEGIADGAITGAKIAADSEVVLRHLNLDGLDVAALLRALLAQRVDVDEVTIEVDGTSVIVGPGSRLTTAQLAEGIRFRIAEPLPPAVPVSGLCHATAWLPYSVEGHDMVGMQPIRLLGSLVMAADRQHFTWSIDAVSLSWIDSLLRLSLEAVWTAYPLEIGSSHARGSLGDIHLHPQAIPKAASRLALAWRLQNGESLVGVVWNATAGKTSVEDYWAAWALVESGGPRQSLVRLYAAHIKNCEILDHIDGQASDDSKILHLAESADGNAVRLSGKGSAAFGFTLAENEVAEVPTARWREATAASDTSDAVTRTLETTSGTHSFQSDDRPRREALAPLATVHRDDKRSSATRRDDFQVMASSSLATLEVMKMGNTKLVVSLGDLKLEIPTTIKAKLQVGVLRNHGARVPLQSLELKTRDGSVDLMEPFQGGDGFDDLAVELVVTSRGITRGGLSGSSDAVVPFRIGLAAEIEPPWGDGTPGSELSGPSSPSSGMWSGRTGFTGIGGGML